MPLSWNEIRTNAIRFSKEWATESSEDAEAKSFWDDFFLVFGIPRRRVAVYEKLVAKAKGKAGYIDLFWPKVLIAEHKSRGKDLARAFDQAIDYFPGIDPADYPQYVIVSDFARISVTNLDSGDSFEFPLTDLHKNVSQFGFIAGYEARSYKEQDPVNIWAAERLAELHDALKAVGYEGHELEVYLVRLLFCMFAEDTGIFMPRECFQDLIKSRTAEDGSDLAGWLADLFYNLNRPVERRLKNLDEQIAAFPYVNGKLFEEALPPAAFDRAMRDKLLACCDLNWGAISPAIFGSLFQGIMNAKLRRNLGAHYTSEKNILKVIGPLFMDELWAEFESIKTQNAKLKVFHEKIAGLQFFDPACGCGNFLVISYRELRLLEIEVIKRLYGKAIQQLSLIDAIDEFVKVNVNQFHGIEIEEWPAQIARVAMWLIDHQMNVLIGASFGRTVVRIPLVKSANVVHGDALSLDWNEVIASERCTYILGNPPFIGSKMMTPAQRKSASVVFDDIPNGGILDFVAAWYLKAGAYMSVKCKAAFVSTNSIVQGEQVSVLWGWMLQHGLKINFAHRTFKWRNEAAGVAAVHCVIVGFAKVEAENRIIYEYDDIAGDPHAVKARNINPYLVDAVDVMLPNRSTPICPVPEIGIGNKPIDGGFYLFSTEERDAFIEKEPQAKALFREWIGSEEFINGEHRWCLWLGECLPSQLRSMPHAMQLVNAVQKFRLGTGPNKKGKNLEDDKVRPESTRKLAERPTRFHVENMPDKPYLVIPEVSSERRVFIPIGYVNPEILASNLVKIMPGGTLFEFGVLNSTMHMAWVRTVCGRLKSDYRYSVGIVYNNFPWPMKASEPQRDAIVKAAQGILDARKSFVGQSLADLYDPLSMPPALLKAHQVLDRAVDAAYGPSGGKKTWASDGERAAFLLTEYQSMTSLFAAVESEKRSLRKSK